MSKNIPLFKVFMSDTVDKPLLDVLHSGFIGQGEKVNEFEDVLKDYFHNDYIATVNSATSAEHLALHMLKHKADCVVTDSTHGSAVTRWEGINDGDEVLATPLTCFASNSPILANNLKIKWVDIDPNTLNMDLDDLARKISPTTKAIMIVHWGGYPVDLDRLKEIQRTASEMYGFKPAVIEDCAHSFGSTYKGKKLGTHGNICTFSFQAIKHMTTVDGGALIVPHKNLYNKAKLMRWYGIDRETQRTDMRCETDIVDAGHKFHMNDINATIGIENMKHIDEIIQKHKDNAAYYNKELANIDGITLLENKDDRESACWLYTIKVENRDGFTKHLASKGIATSKVHERNDKNTCVKEFITQLPALDSIVDKYCSIPVGWWVTEKDREYIIDCIKEGWN